MYFDVFDAQGSELPSNFLFWDGKYLWNKALAVDPGIAVSEVSANSIISEHFSARGMILRM